MEETLPLHVCHVQNLSLLINRAHILLQSLAISFLFYYRASFFFQDHSIISTTPKLLFPWLLIFSAEIVLSFLWLLGQAYRWRPVIRSVFPERLPRDEKLPSVDVFIFTTDPEREPTLAVMNTVLSAMALDYPTEKINVYLSDDGGSSLTLNGLREAWDFAKWWIPFCRDYKIDNRCPEAYFFGGDGGGEDVEYSNNLGSSDEFKAEREKIKEKYEVFKQRVKEHARLGEKTSNRARDHPSVIEVMQESSSDAVHVKRPLLVYVSREKRPSYPHHFKAGAINVLQRVSGVLSNSPYILVLDCDMYCNDPTSARKAMCFHLDPKISNSLAFVQFPQKFRNISTNDIYDSRHRSAFTVQWYGMDGQRGPCLSGTGYFMKRVALYGNQITNEDSMKLREIFGPSNVFVKSVRGENYVKPNMMKNGGDATLLLEETKQLASCTYEKGTRWGQEVGFLYGSVAENYFTGFTLQSKGWFSVYCDPPRPQFLGCGVTNLNDFMIQNTRWCSGFFEVGLSKYSPLVYGTWRMSILQRMCYSELALPFSFFPLCLFATIPQFCLLNGTPIYPEVSSPYFAIVCFIFVSSLCKHLYEVLATGGSFQAWLNEQRMWMMRSITSNLYGSLDALLKKIGVREARFFTTNKVEDDGREDLYRKGKYDFQTSTRFLAPMVTVIILNMVSFLVGIARVILIGDLNKMFVQIFFSFFILVINYPIIEAMIIRKDKGRIPSSVSTLSALFCVLFLSLGFIIFLHYSNI